MRCIVIYIYIYIYKYTFVAKIIFNIHLCITFCVLHCTEFMACNNIALLAVCAISRLVLGYSFPDPL